LTYPSNIPAELKALRQWVCSEPSKRPVQPDGRPASATDPRTWSTFTECANAARQRGWAVAFVFSEADPYAVVDLDHLRNPLTGETESWALDVMADLGSYTEKSRSGRGWHVIVRAKLTVEVHKKRRVEVYDRAKCMTLTGDIEPFVGTDVIVERDLTALQNAMLADKLDPVEPTHQSGGVGSRPARGSKSEDDARKIGYLIKRLRTRDVDLIENEFERRWPTYYHARNKAKGRRGRRTYIGYSIARILRRVG